jgi:hypothetical protein
VQHGEGVHRLVRLRRLGRASVNQISWFSWCPMASSMRDRAAKDWMLLCMSSWCSR